MAEGKEKSSAPHGTDGSPGQRGPRGDRGELAARILAAARKSYANNGSAGTTLRSVAQDAHVDVALVSYYFTNKQGLLGAVLELPDGFLEGIASSAAAPLDQRGAAMTQAMVSMWERPDSAEILRSILRLAAVDQEALNLVRDIFEKRILLAVSDQLDSEEAHLRAGLVASQMLGLAMTRYLWAVGSMPKIPSRAVVALIAPTVQRYLSGPLDM
jgi:AcrR family transcriptional regulator